MTIGDADHGMVTEPLSPSAIAALGLTIAPPLTHQQPHIQAFHQQERDWSEVLTVPFNAYQTYCQSLQWADVVLTRSLQVEQAAQSFNVTPISSQRRINLSQWLQQQIEPEWVAIADLTNAGILRLSPIATRQGQAMRMRTDPDTETDQTAATIVELIRQLTVDATNEFTAAQQRRAVRQLGAIAQGNQAVIQAIVSLLRSAQDDETRWAAVESLWQIDPGNPVAGVRRVRLLDWGTPTTQPTVALAVAVIQKSDQQMGVMLRVYPTSNAPYLPEGLRLILRDDAKPIYTVAARQHDFYLQLKFSGHPKERFSVQISLGAVSIIENFVL
jgi:hypothetical protein